MTWLSWVHRYNFPYHWAWHDVFSIYGNWRRKGRVGKRERGRGKERKHLKINWMSIRTTNDLQKIMKQFTHLDVRPSDQSFSVVMRIPLSISFWFVDVSIISKPEREREKNNKQMNTEINIYLKTLFKGRGDLKRWESLLVIRILLHR